MKPCQWPDEDNVRCGEPAAKTMRIYGTRPNGEAEEWDYCAKHMPVSRERKVEAAGWIVVAA